MAWFPKQKIVVPVDFSDESFVAVDKALQLAADPAQVLVLHVLQDMAPLDPETAWGTIEVDTRIRHATQALRERLTRDHHENLSLDVVLGDPGREIVAVAEREHADLIVLTSHGRTGLRRLLIGSVAERVVRLAHCPVLVLRK